MKLVNSKKPKGLIVFGKPYKKENNVKITGLNEEENACSISISHTKGSETLFEELGTGKVRLGSSELHLCMVPCV